MRSPTLRVALDDAELVVDNFAGGGGATIGVERALGRPVDIAINHSPEAIAMYRANHPETRCYCENIWEVDPREVCAGRPVGFVWFSPDCTHHSRAKGGRPREKKIRGLAWVVTRWAKEVRPRVIVVENVEEFASWGPLTRAGQPHKRRVGETFRAWVRKLESYGYRLEWRSLVAADYGTPTTRRRLFLVARRDGAAIRWPERTHGKGCARAWVPAAEIIDWSLPCPSIFGRRKPLREATLRRIARGVERYVINAAVPFIVPVTHPRDRRVHGIDEPLRTVTAANRGELALVSPTLIQASWGERAGQAPRVPGLHKPLGTVVAGGVKHALVAAFLSKHYGGVVGHDVHRTIGTVTSKDHHAVTAAFLTKFYGTSTGADAREPLPTVTASGGRAGGHLAEVRAFLVAYAEDGGQLTLERRPPGVVMVHGETYQIADIGMRMLAPHELFAAQGFPDDYAIAPELGGKPLTKGAQIALAGNSVCPQVAEAIVRANVCDAAAESGVA